MHLPANTFSARHETLGADTSASRGTPITGSATVNVKGAWANIGGATSFAYEAISIFLERNSPAADYVIDIGISDGTNVFVVVPDLRVPALITGAVFAATLPIHIPSGAQISARSAGSVGSAVMDVVVAGHSVGIGGASGFSRAIALYTPASSRGVAIDAGATANTKGAYAELTASSGADIAALFGCVGNNTDIARGALTFLLDIAIGGSGAEQLVLSNLFLASNTAFDAVLPPFIGPYPCGIPASTRFSARLQCSGTTAGDRTIDLALYGLVP